MPILFMCFRTEGNSRRERGGLAPLQIPFRVLLKVGPPNSQISRLVVANVDFLFGKVYMWVVEYESLSVTSEPPLEPEAVAAM
jgi:hypothetical protein